MKMISLPSGKIVPALGLGTWKMGEDHTRRSQEVEALQRGIDLGMTLIDTAEMYGEGGAEEVVAEAIQGRRYEVFIVTKVYPHNASRKGVHEACARSLKRLKVDVIDLYLLHWRGSIPLRETLEGFAELQEAGKIQAFGVSNFDTDDMQSAWNLPHGQGIASNQILYNLSRRGVEHDLLPWLRQHHVPVMAYSPVEQGGLIENRKLLQVAKDHSATPAQLALAWLLAQEDVIVIPKASRIDHIEENRAAADLHLINDDLTALDAAFPRPAKRRPLEML